MNDPASEVFIVEDVPSVRERLRVTLEDAGYHFFDAANWQAARRLLRQSPCLLVVILDANLHRPGPEGVLSRVMQDAALARHAYVYLAPTPLDTLSPALRDLLSRLGAAVLQTPFTTDTLLKVVGHAAQRPPATPLPTALDPRPAAGHP